MEEIVTPLIEPLNVQQCREGVTFETEEPDVQDDEETTYFKPENVMQNLYIGDEEEDEEDDDSSPFERMAKKMEDISPHQDGGIFKKILQPGSGNVIPGGSIITFHFNAYLEFSDEPFDSSRLRDKAHKCKLEGGGLILGMELGIATMKKGELSRFLFDYRFAYGKMGTPPRIPAEATVMFEVELIDFVEHAGIDDYHLMSEEEKKDVSFQAIYKHYEQCRQEGKQFWNSTQYRKAFQKYKKGAMYLEDCHLASDEEERQQQGGLLKLYQNMALCCVKLCEWKRCITWCNKALRIDRNDVKSMYNLGKSLHGLGEFDRAIEMLKRAKKQEPNNSRISQELIEVEKSIKKYDLSSRQMCAKMFRASRPETEEERRQEEELQQINQQKEDKSMACSEEFKAQVFKQLQDFKNDPERAEWPFPKYQLTVGEIAVILETADNLGLNIRQVGSGQHEKIKVVKRVSSSS